MQRQHDMIVVNQLSNRRMSCQQLAAAASGGHRRHLRVDSLLRPGHIRLGGAVHLVLGASRGGPSVRGKSVGTCVFGLACGQQLVSCFFPYFRYGGTEYQNTIRERCRLRRHWSVCEIVRSSLCFSCRLGFLRSKYRHVGTSTLSSRKWIFHASYQLQFFLGLKRNWSSI